MFGNKYLVTAVGVALALVIAYNVNFFLSRSEKTSSVRQRAQIPAAVPKQPARLPEKPAAIDTETRDKDPWKRDPFSVSRSFDLPSPIINRETKLGGIIKRDGRGYALLNGKIYGVNDHIGNAIITEIRQHSIVLQSNGRTEEISFEDHVVLKEKTK